MYDQLEGPKVTPDQIHDGLVGLGRQVAALRKTTGRAGPTPSGYGHA